MSYPTTGGAHALEYQPAGLETPILRVFVAGVPVSTNRIWRKGRSGRLYLSPQARAWEECVATEVFAIVNAARFPEPVAHPEAWARPLRVSLTFTLARAGDVDNYVKATLDGLKRGLCVDDKHFGTVEAHLAERTPAKRGEKRVTGCLIEVWPADAPTPEPEDGGEDVVSLLPLRAVRVDYLPAYEHYVLGIPANPAALNRHQEHWLFVSAEHMRQLARAVLAHPELADAPTGSDVA